MGKGKIKSLSRVGERTCRFSGLFIHFFNREMHLVETQCHSQQLSYFLITHEQGSGLVIPQGCSEGLYSDKPSTT